VAFAGAPVSRRDEQDSAQAETINANASMSLKLIVFDFDKNPVAFLRARAYGWQAGDGIVHFVKSKENTRRAA
jgi:hypothetical protein